MPGIPRVRLPHPIAGTGKVAMTHVAEAYIRTIVDALKGPSNE